MRVLLAKPFNLSDHIQPSLGLGYLATAIRKNHEVRIVDCIKEGMDAETLCKFIDRYDPDILGLQCYTFDFRFIKEALHLIKRRKPGIKTVIGGPHPSSLPEEVFGTLNDDLDFLFVGEAEAGFSRLLDLLSAGDKDFSSVPGLTWKENGSLRSNPKIFIDDLDSLGMPAWDLIRPESYPESQHGAFFKKFPIAPIITSRGCPYLCTFCAGKVISGSRIRRRSIEDVLKEILYLYNDFGIREFHIIDDNFTVGAAYAKEFLRKLKTLNLDISWAVPNGVRMDTLDEELLRLMKETGLYLISLGIESSSYRVLRLMKKEITTAEIRNRVRMINDAGIDAAGFFILGYPGETVQSIKKTIRFSTELGLVRANFFTYLPFPGTESYQHLKKRGELDDVDWDRFYFMNAAYVPKGMTRRQLKWLQRLAFFKFYARPRIMIYQIRSIKSLRHLLFLAKRFFHWIVMG